ncbi:signal peptidase I [Candidatus Gracilibacteria bacterium]|nr:MAG: signal peptidase I [Candidatus Gracilibacteria bacterium]
MIVLLVVALFMAVVRWRLFSKANLPGWGSLVPIYNAYLFFKLAGRPGWIWWFLLPPVAAILCIVAQFRIARNFGKGEGFAIGMWFLPVIFYPILAFGSAEFHDREADTQPMSVQ